MRVAGMLSVLVGTGMGCSSPAPSGAPEPAVVQAPASVAPDPLPTAAQPEPALERPPLAAEQLPRKRPDGTHLSMVEIRDSLIPGAGKGLFAKVDIPASTYVGFYDGTYLTQAEVDALDEVRGAYLFLIPECADEPVYTGIAGDLDHPISKVNFAPSTINGEETHLQNVDFLEQCDEPYEKLYTTRFVRAGEELYTDYGSDYPYDFMAFESVQKHFLKATGIKAKSDFTWDYSEQMAADTDE